MLSKWDGSADYRIHAFSQGKLLVKNRGGVEVLTEDPVQQGDTHLSRPRFEARSEAIPADALTMREFAQMVEDARAGRSIERPRQ
jgi:hypothetical protein